MNFFTKTSLLGLLFILFQFSLQAQNCTVNANVSQTICSNETLTLQGNDNGLPGFTFLGWKQISGPSVSITTPLNLQTTVTGFTAGNTYVFRLSALCTDKSTVSDDVTVVVRPITIANAGADVTHCPGNYSLTANTQGVGENGEWSIVGNNGAGIAISNVFSPNSSYSISGTSAGSTTLRWTITNIASGCNSYDEVVITSPGGISPVTAGSDQNLSKCYSSTQSTSLSGSFGGNGLGGQQGTWTVVSGPSVPLFSNPNSSSTDVNGLKQGTYVFRWTVSGPCANGFDEVAITVPAPTADITPLDDVTLTYCDKRTTALLTGKVPNFINETVSWTQVSGPSLAVIATPNSSSTNVSGLLGVGTYSFRYTISNSITGCLSSAVYKIVFANTPTISAGPDLNLGCNITQVNIPINQSGDGETSWQIVNGPVNPNFPSYPTSLVKFSGNVLKIEGLITGGAYDFRVVKTAPTGNLCSSVSDDIKVVVSIEPSLVNAGTAEVLDCSATTAVLAGNIPKSGVGKWTQASGPNQAIIADPFDASTEVSGLINGEYTFEWAILGGPQCIETIGLARVLVSEIDPDIPIAGNDQTVCYGSPIQLDGSIPKLNEKGKWTVISPINGSFNISDIENPKAIFIGYDPGTVYTLRWTVSNSCASLYDEVLITTNDKQGPIAIAEDDVCYPSGTSTFNLKATDPFPGAGFWRQIKGPTVIIDNPNSFNTTVTNVIDGVYEFEWAIVSGSCEPTKDTVIINVTNDVTPSIAGPNQTICSATTTLDANVPLVGQGVWTLVSANRTIIIKEPTNPKTVVENLPVGTWVFSWTITNGNCGTSVSSMQVTVEDKPSIAFAGFDQEKCDNSPVIMNAIKPRIGLGTWSLVSGPNNPTFSDFNSPTTVIENLISGTYIFRWTVSAGLCPDNFDTVQVIVRDISNAGNDVVSCDVGAVPLTGTIGTIGTWSVVSGPGNPTITSTGVNSASATNLSKGETIFRYTIPAVGSCPESIDDVSVIIVGEPSSADAGPDQVLCNNGIIQLNGNIPAIGNGKWSILSGPTTGTFVPSDTAPNATYTNAPSGVYVFQWTISDAGCSNTDQVRVENNETPTNPDAGPDQNQVCGSSTVLAANTPVFGVGNWTQISGPSTAVFSSVILPNPIVSNLVAGDYVFEWSISNGTVCPIERDQVAVKVFTAPTTPDAGPNQRVCEIVPFLQLGGNTITVGTGKWSIYSGPAGTFSDDSNPNANFTPSGPGTYILAWTATNSPCSLVDYVDIIIDAQPTVADAGPEIKVCKATSLFMNANTPVVGIGTWKSKGGPTNPVFVNPNSPTTQVLGLDVGEYFFSWEIENGACNPSVDNLRVTIDPEATLANAGSNQTICNTTTATMSANVPVEGTGLWSFVINPGGAIITDPTSPTSTITGITVGVYRLRWTISNACGSNSSEVNVERISDLVTTAITPNQTICLGGTTTFTTTASGGAVPYTYEWQSSSDNVNWNAISGQNTNQYVAPNNLAVGTYYYRVQVSNSCSTIYSNVATLNIVNDPIVTTQPLGSTICSGNTHTMNVVASGGTGTLLYQWQESSNNTSFSDISGANSASYTTVSLTDNKFYRVKITQAASGCEVISNSVPVYVATIVEQPTNPPTICVGGFETLTAAASLNGGTGTLNYQWQSSPNGNNSWADVSVGSGINTPNYVTDNLTVTTWFRCKITSTETACSLFTNAARVTVVPDPTITTQPVGRAICVGGSENLSVNATGGTPSLTYQWQVSSTSGLGFTDISGARGRTYNTGVINTVETRYYRVIVGADGFGCNPVTSNEAVVTVVPDPIITDQPDNVTICDSTTTTLAVTATGDSSTGPLIYQWQSSTNGSNFSNITGATSDTYTTPVLSSDTFYRVIITQSPSGCRVQSTNAKVSVAKISVQPSTPVAICVGGVVSVSVTTTVVPGATYAYQWQSSTNGTVWNNETNASAITANFTSDALNATTQFRCVVTSTNPNCILTSSAVTATVVPDPTITVQPVSGVICVGGNYSLSVTATNGTPSLNYQWQSSTTSGSGFTDIPGATSNSYNTGTINTTGVIYYQVIVSASGNGCNTIVSNEATVTIVADPIITSQPANTTVCNGTNTTLSVVATGDPLAGSLQYLWESSTDNVTFSSIAGATSSTYTTSNLTTDTYYKVIITQIENGCQTISNSAKVSVAKISVQPTTPAPICVGGVASLSANASLNGGPGTLTYQWQSSPDGSSSWTDVTSGTGINTSNFVTDNLNISTWFRCKITLSTTSCDLFSNGVKVTVVPDPTIDTQPVGGTICTGGNFNLSVQASNGTPSLTYQWQSSTTSGSGFTNISGATNPNLSITSLTQTTYYRVNISASGNGCNTITSSEVAVLVIPDPIIVTQPTANTTICKNGTATLSVVATGGSGIFSYQWQSATSLGGSYTNISGATSNTFTTSSLSATSYFRVVITNSGSGCNTLTSTEATVFVGDISVQPVAPAPICTGGSATVSVTASANGGTATFTYQWESSTNGTSGWSSIGGATSNTYSSPALLSTTYYRCIVTSATPNCTLTSNAVKVEVIPDPSITTQPSDGTICTGGSYNLSVVATNGTPSLTYQWQSSASLGGTYTDISGATSANYSTPALTATSYYRVVVSASGNGCTTLISNPATVTVVADPVISTQPQDGAICVGNSYSFNVVASGNAGLGTLTYQWQTATAISGPFTNVTSGTGGTTANYTTPILNTTTTRYLRVSIKQGASGCETLSNTVVLNISAQPVKPIGSVTQQPSCTNATGIITITSPAEGTGFEYSINGGASYQASSTFSGLTNGVKTITVRKISATTCVSQGTNFTINNRICANPEVFTSINGASGGTTTSVLGSDTLNGSPALLSTVNITVNSTSSSQISLDTSNGLITIAPNTPAGTYTVSYTICEKANLSNCSTTTETVQVTQSIIDAVADVVVPNVNGFVGRYRAINALTNDKLNGASALISQVNMTLITPAISIGGGPVPTLNINDGFVTIAAGTPEGTYTIEYQICEKLNPSNCDKAIIIIPVVAPVIDAVNDSTSPVNGANGNPNLIDVLTNDTLNGSSFAISKVNLTQISGATPNTPGALVPVLNLANGIVSVPVGTPAGTYAINYQICEKLNPSNCDDAVVTITVVAATLIANDDTLGPINGYVGNPNVVNAYFINDTFNGKVVDLSLVTPTILNTAIPVRPGAPVPVLDVATGIVSVPAGTPADDYSIQYQLCEKLNPTNCDVALINIRVLPPPI
ncbi:PKD domain-containing protein, partial [Flavobacterium sp. RSSB_23]|uniref:beta strand repeat-containing protein n=1 Tax=Flavobacterium sp. RSSB_23 TaxID=3447668 RepID=UPI003F3477D3